jgi:hypothetical protein
VAPAGTSKDENGATSPLTPEPLSLDWGRGEPNLLILQPHLFSEEFFMLTLFWESRWLSQARIGFAENGPARSRINEWRLTDNCYSCLLPLPN